MEDKLKSAREMFEELGYELVETNSAGVKLSSIYFTSYFILSNCSFVTID